MASHRLPASRARRTPGKAHLGIRLVGQDVANLAGNDCSGSKTIIPAAGQCCHEVGHHVRRVARTRLADADECFVEKGGRVLFDLWTANRNQLIAAGVRPDAIETAGLCSICDHRFWSHRRDGTDAGRTALFLGLRGN